MKTKILRFFATATVLISFSAAVFGQASANSVANATIVTPIGITNTAAMEFGNIAVSASTSGTVVLPASGPRTTSGGVTLPVVTGTVNAASFDISGEPLYVFTISIPTVTATLTRVGGGSMTAGTFVHNLAPATTGTLDASGAATLTVGGTLAVTNAQTAGSYSTANAGGSPVTVTVNYN